MAETLFKLRCSTEKTKSIDLTTPTAGYTAGQMLKVEDTVLVIVDTKTVGQAAVGVYQADKIVVPKIAGSGITFAAGDIVYFNAAGAAVTNASTSNTICGRALEAAVANDAEVLIDLNGGVPA